MTQPWLFVVGIGEDGLDGLSSTARALVDAAEILIGGTRHLAMLPEDGRPRHPWPSPLSRLVAAIEGWRGRRVCVLASGDPMWFGIGVTLARRIPAAEMVVVPAPSAFSQACARLGWPVAETRCLTLHGRPLALALPHLQPGARLLLLSADGRTPAALAALLREAGWGPSRMTVLSHLGGKQEVIDTATAETWPEGQSPDLNTIALECRPAPGTTPLPTVPGLPDEAFDHDGQLTKRELRAVTLAALAPAPGQRLWDIGAGAGSVAIEWMRCDPRNSAVAIERSPDRSARIIRNAAALGVPGLAIVTGTAPEVLARAPGPPDAIFIGGGLSAPGLLDACLAALAPGGRLVANAVTIEGEATLAEARLRHGGTLIRIGVERAEPIGPYLGWRPLMPVTQWTLRR